MEARAPMTVRLTRTSHGTLPESAGIEIDDEGHATGWQTSGNRVGRFARELSPHERVALDRALTSARDADAPATPDPNAVRPPSGATEQLTADDLPGVVLDEHATPPPGFKKLVRLLFSLREDLVESPVAAIELEVDGPPFRAQLRHVGSEPVRGVRMGTLTVLATLFKRNSAIEDSKTYTVDASEVNGPVWPGWTLPLVAELEIDAPRKGRFLTVSVGTPEVDALGDGVLRSVEFSWMTE
jgi:hypothetical protein